MARLDPFSPSPMSTPESRRRLLLDLIRIPSVTGSPEEPEAADFIIRHLSELDYFVRNPSHLVSIPTPLEGDGRNLFSAAARIMARRDTPKTVVFLSHYDVVGAAPYGELRGIAFDPDRLCRFYETQGGSFAAPGLIYGRGSMDMKCGVALEMELLRDFSSDRDMFDVNIIALFVPDEENSACGMRGAAKYLASLKRAEGLEYIACIDTEPSEPGLAKIAEVSEAPDSSEAVSQQIFLGSIGKLMPAFYCRGVEAHVGNYYNGFSAVLLSSHIVSLAEAAPPLADRAGERCYPSWICLEHSTLKDGYSVTVPSRSVAYFNCLTTAKTPSVVMGEMKDIASRAAALAAEQVKSSHEALSAGGYSSGRGEFSVRVIEFADLFEAAAEAYDGGGEALRLHLAELVMSEPGGDLRDMGIAAAERLADLAGPAAAPPFIAVGFLPPYNPQVCSADVPHISAAADRIVREARERHGVAMDIVPFFAGISDMSYTAFQGSERDIEVYSANCPCWGSLFEVPFGAMKEIDIPVMNIGPCGHDAHKAAERLEERYSLDILPELLAYAVRVLSEEWGRFSCL